MANRRPIVLAGGQPVELPPADTLSVGSAIIGASPVTALSVSSDAGTGETFVDSGLGSFGISFRAKLDGGGRFRWYNNAGSVKLAELGSGGLTLSVPAFLGDLRVSNGANTGTIAFGASGNGPYLAATDSGVTLATGALPFNITGPFANNTSPIYVGAVNATTGAFGGGVTVSGTVSVGAAILANAPRTNTVYSGQGTGASIIGIDGYWAFRTGIDNTLNLDLFDAGGAYNALRFGAGRTAIFAGGVTLGGQINFGTRGTLQFDDNGSYLNANYQHVFRTTATGSNVVVASFRPDVSTIGSNLSVSGAVTSASGSQVRGPFGGETFLELLQPGVKSWSVGMKAGDAALYLAEGTGAASSSFKFAPGGTFTAAAVTAGSNTLGSSGMSTSNITATGNAQVAGTVQALNVLSTGSGAQLAFNSRDASGLGWLWYSGIESIAVLYHSTQGDVFQFNKNGLFTARGGGQFGGAITLPNVGNYLSPAGATSVTRYDAGGLTFQGRGDIYDFIFLTRNQSLGAAMKANSSDWMFGGSVEVAGTITAPTASLTNLTAAAASLTNLTNAANDAAAASAGVAVNGVYRNGSALMIRVS